MNGPDVPESAVTAFERIHGLSVTIHDLTGTLWPYLTADRFQHSLPLCQAIKGLGYTKTCFNFEIPDLRPDLPKRPNGRIHICHAGLVEWVVPVFRDQALEWVLFAGVRLPGTTFRPDAVDSAKTPASTIWPTGAPKPAPVEQDEADLILEHLRQLASRLQVWREAGTAQLPDNRLRLETGADIASRRTLILRFIAMEHARHVTIEDLARRLSLSPSRTSHAVKECCDATFGELLCEARMRTAMGLLRHSELSVVEVAIRAGFDDVRQLQRAFRKQEDTTPLKYRKLARS